jgi:hypothetical protein
VIWYRELTTGQDFLLKDEDVEKGRGTACSSQEKKVGTYSFTTFPMNDAIVLIISSDVLKGGWVPVAGMK